MLYNQGLADLLNNAHDWDNSSQTYKIMLLTAGYTFNYNHVYVSQVSGYELSGTNYTPGYSNTGRKTLTSRSISIDASNNYVILGADNISWGTIYANVIDKAIIYRHLTSDLDSKLIACITGGGLPISISGGTINLNWNTNGVIRYRQY
jgi:hypothetical protein